uniref:Protein maelstrom 1 n=1 Tax=Drosophila pseudoobscura pseudoobscura TaxID=46245 RepID=MAEL1_DROPS|nr:RecName: Full=Protein maelstrom 1 [Drosophila pseudoobscura pseudoobscura]
MAQNKPNAFMAFVADWRACNRFGRGLSTSEAVAKCGPIWEGMSDRERGPYKSKAKDSNVLERESKTERLNCPGVAFSKMQVEKNEAIDAELQMKRNIKRIVLKATNSMKLEEEEFLFVSFNYFTKALNGDVYQPAELSACRFSLKGGISSNYSTMINPGHIIFGQTSDAQDHSRTTHKLPLPPNAMGEKNLGNLYSDTLKWLSASNDEEDEQYDHPVIVYTTPELMPVVKSCFRYLACEGDTDKHAKKIIVYDICYLFLTLKKTVLDLVGVPSDHMNIHVTNSFFRRDFFEFSSGIACDYHEEVDRTKYCTKSMVLRWGYMISHYICGDLAIPLQPRKHVPIEVKHSYTVTPGDSSLALDGTSTDSGYSGY